MAFTIKQHDTRPAYVADLVDNADTTPIPINLTAATSVTFKMRTAGAADATAPLVSAIATIVTPATGRVRHTWSSAHTATVGEYEAEFEIAWNDGGIETIPNDGYATINVIEDLDAN
jgi:hypothetical protein